jgi:hypothetical protein
MIAATGLLTNDVISKTISYTSSTIFILGKSLFYSDHSIDLSALESFEKKEDVLETIRIYDLWIKEIEVKHALRLTNSIALREAIRSFELCLEEIHNILQKIKDKINEHKLKWFYSYRSLSFQSELEQLQVHKTILDHRFTMIQQIAHF